MAVAAWFAADGIAAQLFRGRHQLDYLEMARRLGRVSWLASVALVLIWSFAGVALCRGRV